MGFRSYFEAINVENRIANGSFSLSVFFCFCALIVSTISYANDVPSSYSQCVACHGKDGAGNKQLQSPALAGQFESYLNRQLANFKSGIRGSHPQDTLGKQMAMISQQLDNNKDVPVLAKYLASLPKSTVKQETQGSMKNGNRYYHAKCGACHGGQGEGNESFKAPRIAGQDVAYLKRQMENFSNGLRGTEKADRYGRQMAMMAKTSSGKELDDILHFIAQQE